MYASTVNGITAGDSMVIGYKVSTGCDSSPCETRDCIMDVTTPARERCVNLLQCKKTEMQIISS